MTVLIRSKALAASMSRYLIREIETTPTIDVRYSTEVAGGEAATGAWNSSESGAGTPVKAKLSQPTGCFA